ncbi:hypothetical protein ACFSCX_23480 [Bacillus salitolerans]|uniref:Uncharacterized protein n=1 Tax=Bacillus salitolerans TaxID=1437434 RepID=A0ABW4LWF9_9BACI
MELVVMLFLCWLSFAILFSQSDYYCKKDIAFLLLFTALITTHAYTIFSANFKFISLPKENVKYIAYLLLRSALLPATISLLIHFYLHVKSTKLKIRVMIGAIISFTFIIKLSHSLGLFTYKNWNTFLMVIFLILVTIMAFWFLKLFQRMCKNH